MYYFTQELEKGIEAAGKFGVFFNRGIFLTCVLNSWYFYCFIGNGFCSRGREKWPFFVYGNFGRSSGALRFIIREPRVHYICYSFGGGCRKHNSGLFADGLYGFAVLYSSR